MSSPVVKSSAPVQRIATPVSFLVHTCVCYGFYTCVVSVRLNGTAISDRAVIFHHEVERSTQERNFVCLQFNTTGVSWHYPNGAAVVPFIGSSSPNDDYLQLPLQTDVFLIRNKDAVDINPLNNGLWTCRLGDEFVPVGIYHRGGKCCCCVLQLA